LLRCSFFISGYGITKSYLIKGDSYLNTFLKKRILTIFIPMLLITIIYLIAVHLLKKPLPLNIFYDLIFKGYTPLPNTWFIFSLIYFYVFFYIGFQYSKDDRMAILIVFLLSTIYIVTTYYLGYHRNWWIQTYAFGAGIVFCKYETTLSLIVRKPLFILLSTILVIFFIYLKIEKLLIFPYLVITIVVFSIVSYLPFPYRNNLFKFLSKISFEIYLIHGGLIALLSKDLVGNNEYIYSLVIIAFSLLLAYVFNKIWNENLRPLMRI